MTSAMDDTGPGPTRRQALRKAFAVAAAVAVAGCGKQRIQRPGRKLMRGTVTLDGKPLGGAVITIVSVADPTRMAGAMVRPDGTFVCGDVPVGEVVIGLENDSVRASSGGTLDSLPPVPDRYKNWTTSGLKAVVVDKKENLVQLDLTSTPPATP